MFSFTTSPGIQAGDILLLSLPLWCVCVSVCVCDLQRRSLAHFGTAVWGRQPVSGHAPRPRTHCRTWSHSAWWSGHEHQCRTPNSPSDGGKRGRRRVKDNRGTEKQTEDKQKVSEEDRTFFWHWATVHTRDSPLGEREGLSLLSGNCGWEKLSPKGRLQTLQTLRT